MARPLDKTTNGKLYTRPSEIEAATDAALAQDLHTQLRRALIRDPHDPEYLPSECLLHLVREARRRHDDAARYALLPLLLARVEANLNAKVDGQIPGAVELREDILGDFAELFAIDGSPDDRHELDFFEVRFNMAFFTFRATRVLVGRGWAPWRNAAPRPVLSLYDAGQADRSACAGAGAKRAASKGRVARPDQRWYWAAPLLLDQQHAPSVREWMMETLRRRSALARSGPAPGSKPSMRPYAEILRIDFAVTVESSRSIRAAPIPRPRRPDHKNLQAEATTCRPRQRELLGVSFCGDQDDFLPLGRFCWSVCRVSHTARIIDLRGGNGWNHRHHYRLSLWVLPSRRAEHRGREQWLFLRRQTRPRSESAWHDLRSLAGCTKRWRHRIPTG
jgi:hypothetical protein